MTDVALRAATAAVRAWTTLYTSGLPIEQRDAAARPPCARLARGRVDGIRRSLTERGQGVEPSPGPLFARRDLRILPAARQQAHALEPAERAVQRPVRREQLLIGVVSQLLRQLVAVKLPAPGNPERRRGGANRLFQGHERIGFAAHAEL